MCKPYEFSIELLYPRADVDSNEQLGVPARLSIKDRSGGRRLVHGLIRAMEQLHTGEAYSFKLNNRLYQERSYCVQYGESDQIIDWENLYKIISWNS